MTINESEQWLLSYYRTSEIAGAMFFARLARSIRNPAIQRDLTKHFADEAQHAWYWSECLEQLNVKPLRVADAYQSQYFEAIGVPANLMEVLAITLVFEKRTILQYSLHGKRADVHPLVQATLKKILGDESWHLRWVSDALRNMESEYGANYVRDTLARYTQVDDEIYRKLLEESAQRHHQLATPR